MEEDAGPGPGPPVDHSGSMRDDEDDNMMVPRIDRIVVQDFKSYKGRQIIGPFKSFTAVIGPNGRSF